MKSLTELINNKNSAWDIIQEWIDNAKNSVVVMQPTKEYAESSLYKLQVSTKSVLGAVTYKTSGILVNGGWLRILGSGSEIMRGIAQWNKIDASGRVNRFKDALLIADDVVGGFYAMNVGAFQGKQGNVFYLAPDTLEWEDLEVTYSQFIQWTFSGDIDKFYESFRWINWMDDVRDVSINQGILIYPFLWAEGSVVEERVKKVVAIDELWELTIDNMRRVHQGEGQF